MLLAYLVGVGVIYVQTATQATWGGPPLWPVAVGVVGVAAACAIGFTAGTLFPGRFSAPIVAVAVFVAWFVGVAAANGAQSAGNGMKGTSALLVVAADRQHDPALGVFYHVSPDVSIARVMFMGGVLLVAVGLLALSPAARVPGVRGLSLASTGRGPRVAAAVLVASGVAACATAFSLTGTARNSFWTGWEIPALHDAAGEQPIPYVPDCAGGAFTVCIHPAFEPYLGAMSAALQPAAAEIAGLPGAPVRAEMNSGVAMRAVAGTTFVFTYSTEQEGFGDESFWATPAMARTAAWEQGVQQDFITWFVSRPGRAGLVRPDPGRGSGGDRAAGSDRRPGTAVPAVQPAEHVVGRVEHGRRVGRGGDADGGDRRPDHRRREPVRVAVVGRPARLAHGQPRRAALRRDHAGAAPMTAAGVKTPPVPPAPSAAPWPASRPVRPAARLVWLHLRSRRVPAAVLALAVCAAALRAVLHWQLTSGGRLTQQTPMILEAAAAVVIAVTTHGPFGEAERATGRWLPYLRLGSALALTGAAIGLLQLGVTGASLNGGVLVLARNVIGITGIGLLTSLVTGGLLAWIPQLGYAAFAEYALNEFWRNPWTWPVRPPTDRGAWICAALVFAIGLGAFTLRGARARLADDG